MKKSIGNPIRYKTFVPSYDGFIGTAEKAIGNKLVTVFENKSLVEDVTKVYRFIGTSESKDRDGEVAKLDSWDFTNYVSNPVVLWGHDHSSLPIGKTVGIYKDEVKKVIYFDIELTDSYDFAKSVKALVEEGILRATSVGFRVLDWDFDDKTESVVFTKSELFEISIVNVPANQDAVLQSGKAVEEDTTKSVDVEQFANVITQIQTTLEALNSRVESIVAQNSKPEEKVEEAIPTIVVEATTDAPIAIAVEEAGSTTITSDVVPSDISIAPELIERVTQEVLQRLSQTNQEEIVDEPAPSADVVEDKPIEQNIEPEPVQPVEDEVFVVSVEDLDETDGFVIVNEEEK